MLVIMQEHSTETLHLVENELLRIYGVMIFNIMADLILVLKGAYRKYIADLEQGKAMMLLRIH